ncbi:hypothetical protein LMJ38_24210 [Streptomyces sp. R1]|uniref:hypothetical protein n=1 Tax=Streptomyces sp. R1 TaxID=1509279 RepID=UPI001E3E1CA0|nr:hypothetical protein [Streptomyces sp. R1]MCC8339024.1 hypothetical protein [Streptomyces sp. R1]
MATTPGYPSHILQQYRQRVENDLRLLEQELRRVERSADRHARLDAPALEIAALRQVVDVLGSIHVLLIDAQGSRPNLAMPSRAADPRGAGTPDGLVPVLRTP